ncbi:unnamed protein product, partial [Boreogadus saida]
MPEHQTQATVSMAPYLSGVCGEQLKALGTGRTMKQTASADSLLADHQPDIPSRMSCQAKRPPGEESIWPALHHCGPGEVDRDDLARRRMAGVQSEGVQLDLSVSSSTLLKSPASPPPDYRQTLSALVTQENQRGIRNRLFSLSLLNPPPVDGGIMPSAPWLSALMVP